MADGTAGGLVRGHVVFVTAVLVTVMAAITKTAKFNYQITVIRQAQKISRR